MEAIREFAGAEPETAVVARQAQALLSEYDTTVSHFEVIAETEP